MQFIAQHTIPSKQISDCLVVGIFAEGQMSAAARELDNLSGGYLTRLLQNGDFEGEVCQVLLLHEVPNISVRRLLLVGCGKEVEVSDTVYRKIFAKAVTTLKNTGVKDVVFYLTDLAIKDREINWKIRQAVEVIADGLYVFDQFKSKKTTKPEVLQSIILNVKNAEDDRKSTQAITEAVAIIGGVALTKTLGNLPPNICTPAYLAEQAQQLASNYKTISATVLEEKDMKTLGMGALLAVASGSHQPPKLVILEYCGGIKNSQPIVLVGKGVTFDTGGISIKPAIGMEEMKFDMCGAASVFGILKVVAELSLPLNIVGITPLVENMPGGKAARPGDIVTTMSGQTVEILNTDAEGRLILCDALTYSEKFNPAAVIDIATLTGAIIVALGCLASGLMSNNDELAQALQKAANNSGDKIWQLPIWDEYQEQINSNVADMANLGDVFAAKSIAAACFLARFAKKFPWAHLDIAGTAWKSGKDKAATGRPVPLVVQYLLDCCESNPLL